MSAASLVFFDFDGTLTTRDSLPSFALHSLGKLRTLIGALKALPWILMWKLGAVSNSVAKERLFSFLFRGMAAPGFAACCESFAPEIEKMVRPELVARMARHIAAGDEVYIVSASIGDWIVPWAEKNGVDKSHVIATGAAVENGILTGRFSTPNCHGPEKVRRIQAVVGDIGVRSVVAYGDSGGDLPMLALADRAFMIKRKRRVELLKQ